jgi:hypothetical protein
MEGGDVESVNPGNHSRGWSFRKTLSLQRGRGKNYNQVFTTIGGGQHDWKQADTYPLNTISVDRRSHVIESFFQFEPILPPWMVVFNPYKTAKTVELQQ